MHRPSWQHTCQPRYTIAQAALVMNIHLDFDARPVCMCLQTVQGTPVSDALPMSAPVSQEVGPVALHAFVSMQPRMLFFV